MKFDLAYLYRVVDELGWKGWHPSDYDPTDDQLLALIERVAKDCIATGEES